VFCLIETKYSIELKKITKGKKFIDKLGTYNRVKNKGSPFETFKVLKNSNSSNKVKINDKKTKAIKTLKNILTKRNMI
tara:strand:- start:175 stop:408 length:234 start_codon:yes stop_codon:yes gene_type:complete